MKEHGFSNIGLSVEEMRLLKTRLARETLTASVDDSKIEDEEVSRDVEVRKLSKVLQESSTERVWDAFCLQLFLNITNEITSTY